MKNNESNIQRSTIWQMQSMNKCPVCHGSGYELINKATPESRELYGDDVPITVATKCSYCNGGHGEKVVRIKGHANIPSAFYESDFSKFNWNIYQDNQGKIFDVSTQHKIVKSFIEQFEIWEKKGIGLYIHSRMKGSGKTFLASCICNSLIEKYPMNTKFVSASELIDIQKKGTDTGSLYDRDPIELLCNCKLLVLDDLGQKQTGSDWTNDILFRILDNRMQKRLVTIITSNISIAELQIDDRIVDRIIKICSPIPLPEICVRSRESRQNQVDLFKELGLIKEKKEGESA